MKQETEDRIREAMEHLDEATRDVKGLAMIALVMPHGTMGLMLVQVRSKGTDTEIAHKFYECMRYSDKLPFDLRNAVMTAAAKYLGEQGDVAIQAFGRLVERCRKQWQQTQEVKAVIEDCRQVIDEINQESDETDNI